MAVTKQQFKQFIRPQPGEIVFYVDNGYNVEAINVSTKLNSKVNIYQDLSLITTMSLEINEETRNFYIVSRSLINGEGISGSYWNFEVPPTDITLVSSPIDSTSGSIGKVQTTIKPAPADYRITNTVFDTFGSNVQNNRTAFFVQDVDATTGDFTPVNLQAILSGSADLAQFQESNYSTTGFIRGRYNGSKTSKLDYGIESFISATPFEAAVYPLNLSNSIICSASFQDRDIKNLLFAFDPSYFENALADAGVNELDVDNLVNPSPRKNTISTQVASFNFGNNPSGAKRANITVTGSVLLSSNDLLLYSGSQGQEYLRVNSTTYQKSSNTSVINVSLQALQKYGETEKYPTSVRVNTSGSTVANDVVFKISSDTVYSTVENQLFKVTNRKIYNNSNTEVLIVDDNGKVILLSTTCTV